MVRSPGVFLIVECGGLAGRGRVSVESLNWQVSSTRCQVDTSRGEARDGRFATRAIGFVVPWSVYGTMVLRVQSVANINARWPALYDGVEGEEKEGRQSNSRSYLRLCAVGSGRRGEDDECVARGMAHLSCL